MTVGSGGAGLVSSRVEYFEAPRQEPKKSRKSKTTISPQQQQRSDKSKDQHQRQNHPQQQQQQQGAYQKVLDSSPPPNRASSCTPPPPLPDDSRVDADEDLRQEDVREVTMISDSSSSNKPCEPESHASSSRHSINGNNHHHSQDESNNAGNDTDATPHRRGGGGARSGGQSSSSSVSSKKKKKKSKLPPSAVSAATAAAISAPPQAQKTQPKSEVPGSELTEKGLEHYQKGEFAHAQKAFSTVLKTQSLSVGCEDISVATTLGNLGAVFLKQERLLEAERALAESLAMKKRLAEAVPVVLADTLNNLGNCANLRGDYDESLKYYHQALSELRENRGRRAQVANLLFNIGRLEIQRREWDNALDALSEAWRMTRDVWGNSHIYVAQTLDLLGFVQISTKQYDSAIISFTGALSIYRRINGPLHPDVASALFNVGMVREARGDLDDALEAYKTARDLHIRLGTPEDDPGFTTVRHSIASMQKSVTQKKLAHLVAKHQGTLLKKKQASGLI